MGKLDRLVEILKRLNAGEDPATVKEEAEKFLSSVGPEDLALAEQQLLEAGLSSEDLHKLCPIHMEMMGDELEKMKATLPPGHPLHTMTREHDMILGYLDELDRVNGSIQKMAAYDGRRGEFEKLSHIAEHLVEAERHHQREEEVLFPKLEEKGVSGRRRS